MDFKPKNHVCLKCGAIEGKLYYDAPCKACGFAPRTEDNYVYALYLCEDNFPAKVLTEFSDYIKKHGRHPTIDISSAQGRELYAQLLKLVRTLRAIDGASTQADIEVALGQETQPIRKKEGFWQRLFGRSSQSPSLSCATLKCAGCSKIYKIGEDSVAVALEAAFELVAKTAVVGNSSTPEREDLVATLEATPDNLPGAREKARQNWKLIQESRDRGERRKWRCRACNQANTY